MPRRPECNGALGRDRPRLSDLRKEPSKQPYGNRLLTKEIIPSVKKINPPILSMLPTKWPNPDRAVPFGRGMKFFLHDHAALARLDACGPRTCKPDTDCGRNRCPHNFGYTVDGGVLPCVRFARKSRTQSGGK